jgi:hypothetical protein
MGKLRYVMLHLMSIALVKYFLLQFESTMNSVVFTQEYLQLLPVHFKLQFFSVLERGSQTRLCYQI